MYAGKLDMDTDFFENWTPVIFEGLGTGKLDTRDCQNKNGKKKFLGGEDSEAA